MANYLEFTSSVSWAKVRVGYEETYDSTVKANILTITSIEVLSTQYKAEYYVDGVLNVNGETVLTFKSSTGNVMAAVKATNTWYPIVKDGEPVTATVQIAGSETASIELTGNNFQRFAFYTVDGEDGNGWGVSESQEIALTVKKWNAQDFWTGVALSLAAEGLPQDKAPTAYLYNGVKLPALPEWELQYATIWRKSTDIIVDPVRYGLVVSSEPIYWVDGSSIDNLGVISAANTIAFDANVYADAPNEVEWVESTRNEDYTGIVNEGYDALWANHDVYVCTYSMLTNTYTVTDTLHMAASEPTPVYE